MRHIGKTAIETTARLAWAAREPIAALIDRRLFQADARDLAAFTTAGVAFSIIQPAPTNALRLRGLAAAPACPGKAVVVYLHGNGGNATKAAETAACLVAAGFDLIVADYRGYGGNPGVPSEAGLMDDASTFVAYAHRMAAGRPILLVGHSLGGAVAILLAARSHVTGLLTIGAVARVSDLVPWGLRPFARHRFDALAAAPGITVPWILCHGEHDRVVPYADASRLLRSGDQGRRRLVSSPAGGHPVDRAALLAMTEQLYDWVKT